MERMPGTVSTKTTKKQK